MKDFLDSMENLPSSTYYNSVFGSIALSILLYIFGKKEAAIFVGLWAPTILNLGMYNKILRPSKEPESLDLP